MIQQQSEHNYHEHRQRTKRKFRQEEPSQEGRAAAAAPVLIRERFSHTGTAARVSSAVGTGETVT